MTQAVDATMLYEALIAIECQMASVEADLLTIRNEIAGTGEELGLAVQLGAPHDNLVNLHAGQCAIDMRLDRIKRRLGSFDITAH